MKKIVLIVVLSLSVSVFAQKEKKVLNKTTNQVEYTAYYADGSVELTGFFNNKGKLHGIWTNFDKENNIIARGEYINGKRVGKWLFWEKDKLKEIEYVDHKIVDITYWDRNDLVINN